MSRLTTAVALTVAILASSCSTSEPPLDWTDATELGEPVVSNATQIAAGSDYQLLIGTSTADTGSTPARCIQLVIDTVGLGCIETDPDPGTSLGLSAAVRSGDVRIFWRARTTNEEPDALSHFVVWSSLSPNGRRVEPVKASGTTHLIWPMETNEAPWGIQTVAADGTLIQTTNLVGYPDQ